MDNRRGGHAAGHKGSGGRDGTRAGQTNLVAACFALTALAYGLARFAYGLFVPLIRADLDLDRAAAGWVGSASFAACCAGVRAAFLAVPRWGQGRSRSPRGLARRPGWD